MVFNTEIDIKPFEAKIEYRHRVFAIGSCFAQKIGERLTRAKFRCTTNPTGVLFNPDSICNTIERLSRAELIRSAELREGASGYCHYDFHSSLSAPSAEETLDNINSAIESGCEALSEADWVVITLGTAWVYEAAESGHTVANCHKEPARNFTRRRLSVAEIVDRLSAVIDKYLADKRLILTVSPIRHIADGMAENSLSKATLRLAIDEIVTARPERAYYFPSFEIMMDDLRDYRFYGEDMVHPSAVAVSYIWEKLCETALSPSTRDTLARVEQIVKAAEHRPTNPSSEAHRTFCRKSLQAIDSINEVDFSKERAYFKNYL